MVPKKITFEGFLEFVGDQAEVDKTFQPNRVEDCAFAEYLKSLGYPGAVWTDNFYIGPGLFFNLDDVQPGLSGAINSFAADGSSHVKASYQELLAVLETL